MNNRIKELEKQAWDYACDLVKGDVAFDGYINVDFSDAFSEKFAELIIKQCGYYADIFDAAGCPVGMDPTETKPSDYIKKQFGVD